MDDSDGTGGRRGWLDHFEVGFDCRTWLGQECFCAREEKFNESGESELAELSVFDFSCKITLYSALLKATPAG